MLDIHIKVTDGLELFNQVIDEEIPPDMMIDESPEVCVSDGGKTQCYMVLRYMKDYGSITPIDAMREFGIMRLGARIYDLKAMGHRIEREMLTSQNRYGKAVTFASYSLRGATPCP